MLVVPFKALAAQTATTTGDAFKLDSSYEEALFVLDVTALATDVGDTLDVFLDVSPDGVTWFNSAHFTQILGNGAAAKIAVKVTKGGDFADHDAVLAVTSDASAGAVRNLGIMPFWRYRSTVVDNGVDNASFTYSLTGYFIE
jgi:hypothetical protein